jgi:hypothetical protein
MNQGLALALLLVAGHLLGDFLVQSTTVATRKHRFVYLLRHGLESYLTMALVLWPFWSPWLFPGLFLLVLVHLAVDAWKVRSRSGLGAFLLDQTLHLVALAGFWALVTRTRFSLPDQTHLTADSLGWYVAGASLVGLVAFNVRGGCSLVKLAVVGPDRPRAAESAALGRGETIGYLERLLIMLAVFAGQWGLVGLVMAAKSIARFKELDNKEFAEYYLVGTLTSVLVAVVVGSAGARIWALCFPAG